MEDMTTMAQRERLIHLQVELDKKVKARDLALEERAELEADLREVSWRTGSTQSTFSPARQAYDRARTIYLNAALAKTEKRVEAADAEVRTTIREIDAIKDSMIEPVVPRPERPARIEPTQEQADLIKRSLDAMLGGL